MTINGQNIYLGGDGTGGGYSHVMTEAGPSTNVFAKAGLMLKVRIDEGNAPQPTLLWDSVWQPPEGVADWALADPDETQNLGGLRSKAASAQRRRPGAVHGQADRIGSSAPLPGRGR